MLGYLNNAEMKSLRFSKGRRATRHPAVVALSIATSKFALAASFDCNRASRPDERSICASRRSSEMDVEMAARSGGREHRAAAAWRPAAARVLAAYRGGAPTGHAQAVIQIEFRAGRNIDRRLDIDAAVLLHGRAVR